VHERGMGGDTSEAQHKAVKLMALLGHNFAKIFDEF